MEKYGQLPSLSEVARIASIFDKMGDVESAALLDEYLEKASEFQGDIIKQAGFWSNVWKRLKGKAKTWFISEYKELHDAAKEAQQKIEDRIEKLIAEGKKIKQNFKNYELGEWHQRIQNLDIMNSYDILLPFNKKYGKFLQYITRFEDKKEDERQDMTPSERIMSQRGLKDTDEIGVSEWVPLDYRNENYMQVNTKTSEIRVLREAWTKKEKKFFEPVSPDGKTIKLVDPEKAEGMRTPLLLKALTYQDIIEIASKDEKYVYLRVVNKLPAEKTKGVKKPTIENKDPLMMGHPPPPPMPEGLGGKRRKTEEPPKVSEKQSPAEAILGENPEEEYTWVEYTHGKDFDRKQRQYPDEQIILYKYVPQKSIKNVKISLRGKAVSNQNKLNFLEKQRKEKGNTEVVVALPKSEKKEQSTAEKNARQNRMEQIIKLTNKG